MYLLVHNLKSVLSSILLGETTVIALVTPVQDTMHGAALLCLSRYSPNSALQLLV